MTDGKQKVVEKLQAELEGLPDGGRKLFRS